MAWLLLTVTGVLAVTVGVLALRVRRLERRLAELASSDATLSSERASSSNFASLDEPPPASRTTEYVITHVGEPEPEQVAEPAPSLSGPLFADIVLRETVVQTASLFQGLRRALAPETLNRIRFQMRQEVKRSRKQRRAEQREVRREWAARQRAAMAAEEGNAA
jgi:hypothetical protein